MGRNGLTGVAGTGKMIRTLLDTYITGADLIKGSKKETTRLKLVSRRLLVLLETDSVKPEIRRPSTLYSHGTTRHHNNHSKMEAGKYDRSAS